MEVYNCRGKEREVSSGYDLFKGSTPKSRDDFIFDLGFVIYSRVLSFGTFSVLALDPKNRGMSCHCFQFILVIKKIGVDARRISTPFRSF
jgi:hypothetical protein